MWARKMKESGSMRDAVIWVKILFHEMMIFKDSLKIPKKPRNCRSSCSLSMIFFFFFSCFAKNEATME